MGAKLRKNVRKAKEIPLFMQKNADNFANLIRYILFCHKLRVTLPSI